jgi:hypothetical protein
MQADEFSSIQSWHKLALLAEKDQTYCIAPLLDLDRAQVLHASAHNYN